MHKRIKEYIKMSNTVDIQSIADKYVTEYIKETGVYLEWYDLRYNEKRSGIVEHGSESEKTLYITHRSDFVILLTYDQILSFFKSSSLKYFSKKLALIEQKFFTECNKFQGKAAWLQFFMIIKFSKLWDGKKWKKV